MPQKRRQAAKSALQKQAGPKTANKIIHAKSGKLSKTDLQALFSDPALWASLSVAQQQSVLEALRVRAFFGEGHPQRLESGEYMNYIITSSSTVTRVDPDLVDDNSAMTTSDERGVDISSQLDAFRQHLTEGRFDPRWMKSGQEISLQRARGDYDEFWRLDPETALSDKSKTKVDAVKMKRMERIKAGLEARDSAVVQAT